MLGWTALHWAVSKRHYEAVEAILRHHKSSNWAKPCPSTLLKDLTYQDAVNRRVNAVEIAASIGDTKIFDALTNCLEIDCSISDDLSFNKIWSAEKFDNPISNPWRTRMKAKRYVANPLGDDVKDTREWKSKLLLSAIKDKKMDIAKLLVHNGADVNYFKKATPLHAAVLCREPEFCRQLIRMGARLETVDERGFAPLHHAVLNGDIDVVRVLLQNGSNANARATEPAPEARLSYYSILHGNSATPLILIFDFLSLGYESRKELALQLAVLLIQHGADVNLTDKEGRTVLHYAIVNPYGPLIECLLKAGARSDLQDMDGWTPFHDLAAAGHVTEYGNEWLR